MRRPDTLHFLCHREDSPSSGYVQSVSVILCEKTNFTNRPTLLRHLSIFTQYRPGLRQGLIPKVSSISIQCTDYRPYRVTPRTWGRFTGAPLPADSARGGGKFELRHHLSSGDSAVVTLARNGEVFCVYVRAQG